MRGNAASQPSSWASRSREMSSVRWFATVFGLRWSRSTTKPSTSSTPTSPSGRCPKAGRTCRLMMLSSSAWLRFRTARFSSQYVQMVSNFFGSTAAARSPRRRSSASTLRSPSWYSASLYVSNTADWRSPCSSSHRMRQRSRSFVGCAAFGMECSVCEHRLVRTQSDSRAPTKKDRLLVVWPREWPQRKTRTDL
jgi:hypothetical protein